MNDLHSRCKMFKVLLLAGLVLVANCEYNLYFNDTTYLDSFREGDFYFQVEQRIRLKNGNS